MLKIFLMGMMMLSLGCSSGSSQEVSKDPAPPKLQESEVKVHSHWGWRSPTCTKFTDWKTLSFESDAQADAFSRTISLLDVKAPVPKENCFRIGTEVLVFNSPKNTSLAARAIITKITEDNERAYVQFDVIERFHSLRLSFPGDRIPNCDGRYNDWNDFYIYEDIAQQSVDLLVSGKRTISIWNGAYNCYRVGSTAEVVIKGNKDQTFGSVTVREVRLLPYSDVTDQMLLKTGEKIEDVRARLEANLDRNGGYVSMMAFDYNTNP